MPLRAKDHYQRNPWCWVAAALVLAVATIGFDGMRNSGARAEPANQSKEAPRKGAPKAKPDAGKRQITTVPKAMIPGNKAVVPGTKTAVPGTALPNNAIGRTAPGNTGLPKATNLQTTNPKSVLSKGIDTKNAKGPLTKGADPKGLSNTALPKGVNPKGLTTAALPKGVGPKGAFPAMPRTSPHFAATAPERFRLRNDHRMALAASRILLPPRPFPGERGFTGVPPIGETRYVTTEMVFHAGPEVSRQTVDATAARLGVTIIGTQQFGITGGTIYHFRLAGGRQVADVVRTLEAQNIGTAQPNYTYRLFQEAETELAAQSQPATSQQYVINQLHLDEAHKIATGNNVLVAVIDSMIDVDHPDIAGEIAEQFDAVGRAEKPHSHGTGMAGAIVAHRRLMGIAPGAKILAVRAFSSGAAQSPEATTRNILTGIDWAIKKGARIINMSFAGPYDPMLQLAMKNARAKGVILIAASGNMGPKSPPLFPAADPNVIGVTAVDMDDKLFDQAVRGPQVAIAAPGVDVMVPAPEETYQLTTGTSVAAAHVSGVAALLLERQPNASAATILEVLTASAKRLNPKGRDNLYGWGLVDPAAALAELDSRADDSKVASVAKPETPAAPKAAAPKGGIAKQTAPRAYAPRPASTSPQ